MRTPFYKSRADAAAHYRRDGDFVQIKEVYPDDLLGPSYDVVRDADNTIIRGVRGPKHTRFAEGNTAFLRFMGGSHYYCQLEGVAGGSATTSLLSRLPEDFTGDDYVQRAGDTLSGTLAAPDNTLEVDFVDGLLVFRQAAGVSEQGGDLELSSAAAGKWGLSQLIHHGARHENGGADEINVAGLNGLLADAQTPLAHKTTHQDGGGDEINVGGLAGLLADAQTPLAHNISHQHGGSDEISLSGLAGLAADSQTPLAHKASHQYGGADEISLSGLAGQAADPQKIAVRKNWEANVGVRPRLHLSEGTNISMSVTDNGTDDEVIVFVSATGEAGPTSPGGNDGEIQYNNGGSFGGDSALFWDDTNKRLGIGTSSPSTGIEMVSETSNGAEILATRYGQGIGGWFGSQYAEGTKANPSASVSDKIITSIGGSGHTGSAFAVKSQINLKTAGTWSTSSNPTKIDFRTTAADSTTLTIRLTIGSDGNLTCPATYSNNVGAVRQMYINSSGLMGYNSSSRRVKENIKDAPSQAKIHELKPRIYDRKDGSAKGELGLIAEEVVDIYPELVSYERKEKIEGYDKDGVPHIRYDDSNIPETVCYDRLITPLLIEVQVLKKRCDAMEKGLKVKP
jgi:hypothetical protein